MTDASLPVLAGSASTVLFVASTLPMLLKAIRTKDLGSYSVGNLVLANVGNLVHAIYVFSLPPGPIWALHSFYLVTSFAMLAMWLYYCRHHCDAPRRALSPPRPACVPTAGPPYRTLHGRWHSVPRC